MDKQVMFFELVDHYDLNSLDISLMAQKVRNMSVKEIHNICEGLSNTLHSVTEIKEKMGRFDFVASNSLSAMPGYSCDEPGCRIKKILHVVNFAVMYSNKVYLPNYFHQLCTIKNKVYLQKRFFSDILLVNAIRPAIESGHVELLEIGLCSDCIKEYSQDIDSRFPDAFLENLEDKYLESTKIFVEKHLRKKEFLIESELWEHGGIRLRGHIALKTMALGQLSKTQMKETKIISERLNDCVADLRYHSIASNVYRAPFLTDSLAQEALLSQSPANIQQQPKINDALKMLFFDTPIFDNLSLQKVIEVRSCEEESFEAYRQALKKSLQELVNNEPSLTPELVHELFGDMLHQEVEKLDRKIRLTRSALTEKLLFNVTVVGVGLGIGFSLGIPIDFLKTFGALSYLGQALSAYHELSIPSPEVKTNDLYFLWKINKEKTLKLNR